MRRVKIAILDTGIDRTHPRIEAQWNKRVKDAKMQRVGLMVKAVIWILVAMVRIMHRS